LRECATTLTSIYNFYVIPDHILTDLPHPERMHNGVHAALRVAGLRHCLPDTCEALTRVMRDWVGRVLGALANEDEISLHSVYESLIQCQHGMVVYGIADYSDLDEEYQPDDEEESGDDSYESEVSAEEASIKACGWV